MAKKIQKTVVFFLEDLDFKQKKSPHTIKAYATDLLQSLSFLIKGELKGPKIDGSEDYAFVPAEGSADNDVNEAELHGGVSKHLHTISKLEASTRGRKVATLRKFYQYLKQEKIVEKIPAFLITPKKPTKIPRFISVDEAISIMSAMAKHPTAARGTQRDILFLLLYGAGLRVSEACALRWEHVDLVKRQLRILGKGEKTRVISFPKLLQARLSALRSTMNSPYVWGDKALNTRTAYNMIRQCGVLAGLNKPLNPHALRHSFATHLLSDGADLRIIQELLGHSSLSATEKYTHISIDQLAQTMESFHPLAKKG